MRRPSRRARSRSFVGDGRQFGFEVAYSFDGDMLLGTGGALRRALPLLGEPFSSSMATAISMSPIAPIVLAFRRSGAPALMTVFRNEGRWDTSNVLFDGTRVVRYDKRAPSRNMRYIDYGLGILTAEVLASRKAGASRSICRTSTRGWRRPGSLPVTR